MRSAKTRAFGAAEVASLRELATLLDTEAHDLLAHYEAKSRIIRDVQIGIQTLRSSDNVSVQQQTFERLERRFSELVSASRAASKTLMMVRREFARVRRRDAQRYGRSAYARTSSSNKRTS